MGKRNPCLSPGKNKQEVKAGGENLDDTEFEKDLWVMVHQSLKPSMQFARAAKSQIQGQEGLQKLIQDLCKALT